jgi:drug/metabolite transporter (DMT)-like permease
MAWKGLCNDIALECRSSGTLRRFSLGHILGLCKDRIARYTAGDICRVKVFPCFPMSPGGVDVEYCQDRAPSAHRNEWLRLILLGILLYAGTQGAVFVALDYLPAVTVNLLWSFSSAVIAILGITFLSERPSFFQWAGMLLTISGAVIYFYPAEIPVNQTVGFIVAVLGILSNAASSILGRDINRLSTRSPLVVTVISMGAGSVILLGAGISIEGAPALSLQSWTIIIWLALVNTAFAFTLWNHTLRTLTAMQSSIINGTMLVWVAIFAVIFLGETLTPRELIGLVATGIGTIVVQLRARAQTENRENRKLHV